LVSVVLLSVMAVTSIVAQPRIVGVAEGDWFKFETIDINWSSNHPNATFPPPGNEWIAEMNETEWATMTIGAISGTNITIQMLGHYKNETEETESGYIDIETGDGNYTFQAISANLNANDTLYASGSYSTWKINETIVRTYPDSTRETNHVNMTYEYSWNISETQYYYYYSMNFYWDRITGFLVEDSFEEINQTGEYTTTWSALFRITDSNVWVIPEFPTWSSVLLAFAVLTVSIIIIKRGLFKIPAH